jgi:1-deoxy-D-xylulose-5-phosphate reductoisomerase
MRTLAVLGATGSIGASTLDVVARHPDRYRIGALAAHRSAAALADLCARFRPDLAVIADPGCEAELREHLRSLGVGCRVESGAQALIAAAADAHCDTVVAAIVGAAGLESTLAAARAGKRLLLANKEAVVMAGALLADALALGGGELLPLDSEHNAVFQCLPREPAELAAAGVRRILLTASGGPFRGLKAADLGMITPERACAHPNWRMGRKISVDSATLMNKGLEVIEAHHLFRAPAERIEVVVHPQSVVQFCLHKKPVATVTGSTVPLPMEMQVPTLRTWEAVKPYSQA